MSRPLACADRSGFLFAHACDRPAAGTCSVCHKPICTEHTRMGSQGVTCVSCLRGDDDDDVDGGTDSDDSEASKGRGEDDPYFYGGQARAAAWAATLGVEYVTPASARWFVLLDIGDVGELGHDLPYQRLAVLGVRPHADDAGDTEPGADERDHHAQQEAARVAREPPAADRAEQDGQHSHRHHQGCEQHHTRGVHRYPRPVTARRPSEVDSLRSRSHSGRGIAQ